jgi:hypothetical protein
MLNSQHPSAIPATVVLIQAASYMILVTPVSVMHVQLPMASVALVGHPSAPTVSVGVIVAGESVVERDIPFVK